MAWTDSFWKPIKLNDGRTLTTLGDARELISKLPRAAQVAQRWLDADEMLVRAEAAPSARDDALAAVVARLEGRGAARIPREGIAIPSGHTIAALTLVSKHRRGAHKWRGQTW